MLASHNWLMELTGLALAPAEVATRLTAAGLEVEAVRNCAAALQGVVVAEVRAIRPHPARENLRLVTLHDGEQEQEVVCGASNVPAPGGLVAFARLGATLPGGMRIDERKLGGVVSRGMICSEVELDIGSDSDGILIIESGSGRVPGAPLAAALALSDTIYTIGLTPNRPDCLGHVGIARELCAVLAAPFAAPAPAIARQLAASSAVLAHDTARFLLNGAGSVPAQARDAAAGALPVVRIRVTDPERCPRYGAALVVDAQIKASPFEIRYRLHTLGLRAINNVVDATNLILLGWGYPIHAFDLAKLRGGQIEVRLARAGESMQTLDGVTRTLSEDDLLICDGEGPIALAGVMGGANSEIDASTRHVLIECAYFEPRSVRRTSKRTGLHTDSSHRFERGVDPEAVRTVLAHAASSIASLSGGAAQPEAFDVRAAMSARANVSFRVQRASALLGTAVDPVLAGQIFERLGCQVQIASDVLNVQLPSFRPDLSREVDLIEEYARVQGYDSIPTLLPRIRASSEDAAPEIGFVRRIRETGVAVGLAEAINFAFVAPADLARVRVPLDAPRVANPMSEERCVLRTALLPGLLQNLLLAQRHQQRRFAGFEVARVFREAVPGPLPDERYELGVLLWGLRQSWYDERESLDFYDLKGMIESLTRMLTGQAAQTLSLSDEALESDAPFLHPRRGARISLAGVPIGVAGELHPDVVAAVDLSGRPVYATIDVASLQLAARTLPARRVDVLPRFPASTRDLAVVVAETLAAGDVAQVLQRVAPELTESVRLFDIYRGTPVPDGHKSLAFHVIYRDSGATLTDKRVDDIHARVTAAAEQQFGGAVRR